MYHTTCNLLAINCNYMFPVSFVIFTFFSLSLKSSSVFVSSGIILSSPGKLMISVPSDAISLKWNGRDATCVYIYMQIFHNVSQCHFASLQSNDSDSVGEYSKSGYSVQINTLESIIHTNFIILFLLLVLGIFNSNIQVVYSD